jgi:hypothetical protein
LGSATWLRAAQVIAYPTLLDLPAPRVRAYSRESVVAEKFQALVALGFLNSRMKDFYDIWTMSREFDFDGQILSEAIRATFLRRKTTLPEAVPVGLSAEFANDTDKSTQWVAFLRRSVLEAGGRDLRAVLGEVQGFLMPPAQAAAVDRRFTLLWPAGGPWRCPIRTASTTGWRNACWPRS